MRKLANLIVYQRDIRRVNGNVASYAAHRNADSRFLSAGASLTPSPIMQTFAAIVLATASWSPVSRTGCTESSLSRASICSLSGRSVSASTKAPANRPS